MKKISELLKQDLEKLSYVQIKRKLSKLQSFIFRKVKDRSVTKEYFR